MKDRFLLAILLVAVLVSATAGGLSAIVLLQPPGPTDESGMDGERDRPDGDTASNQLPNARFIWSPKDPRAGVQVTFDASASTDPDGSIALYRWTFGEAPPVHARGPLVFRTFRDGGIEHVELTVFDNQEGTGSAGADITVRSLVPYETLWASNWDSWEEPDAFLIQDGTRWAEVWNLIRGGSPQPEVDFANETVIVVTSGLRLTTLYGLWIHEILFDGEDIEVHVNLTYPAGIAGAAITYPLHVVKIQGKWSEATYLFNHSLCCDQGGLALGTSRSVYTVGETVTLSVKSELNDRGLNFGPSHPLNLFQRVGEEWTLIRSWPTSAINTTLSPGESFAWNLSTGDAAGDAGPLDAGFYRLDLYMRIEGSWTDRFTTFFDLL